MTRTTKKTTKPTKTAKPARSERTSMVQPTLDARAEALGIVEVLAAHGLEQAELQAICSAMPPGATIVDLMRRGLDALDAKRATRPAVLSLALLEKVKLSICGERLEDPRLFAESTLECVAQQIETIWDATTNPQGVNLAALSETLFRLQQRIELALLILRQEHEATAATTAKGAA